MSADDEIVRLAKERETLFAAREHAQAAEDARRAEAQARPEQPPATPQPPESAAVLTVKIEKVDKQIGQLEQERSVPLEYAPPAAPYDQKVTVAVDEGRSVAPSPAAEMATLKPEPQARGQPELVAWSADDERQMAELKKVELELAERRREEIEELGQNAMGLERLAVAQALDQAGLPAPPDLPPMEPQIGECETHPEVVMNPPPEHHMGPLEVQVGLETAMLAAATVMTKVFEMSRAKNEPPAPEQPPAVESKTPEQIEAFAAAQDKYLEKLGKVNEQLEKAQDTFDKRHGDKPPEVLADLQAKLDQQFEAVRREVEKQFENDRQRLLDAQQRDAPTR